MKVENVEKFLEAKLKLEKEGTLKVRVATDSMEPWLKVGEFYNLKPVDVNKLEFPQIIAYWYRNSIFLHFFWQHNLMKNCHGQSTFSTRSLKLPRVNEGPHSMGNLLGVLDYKISFYKKCQFYLRYFIKGRFFARNKTTD